MASCSTAVHLELLIVSRSSTTRSAPLRDEINPAVHEQRINQLLNDQSLMIMSMNRCQLIKT